MRKTVIELIKNTAEAREHQKREKRNQENVHLLAIKIIISWRAACLWLYMCEYNYTIAHNERGKN